MESEFRDGRLLLQRSAEEREPILNRLRRIEGQVRGLRQMLEQDRYCPDELQQANAVIAAVRAVALVLAQQHLVAAAEYAARSGDHDGVLHDIMNVLQSALRQ